MPDYEALYYKLFNRITDADLMLQKVTNLLKYSQTECEELIARSEDPPDSLSNQE